MEYDFLGNTVRISVIDSVGSNQINNTIIREIRKKRKMSVKEVAEQIGKSYDIVWCYESGSFLPNGWYDLKKLCLALEISANDIFALKTLLDNEFNNHVIVKARKRKEYSIRTLSAILDKGGTNAYRFEHDICIPESWITLKKLCRVLDIEPDTILGITVCKEII